LFLFFSSFLPRAAAAPALSIEGMNKNSVFELAGLYLTRSEILTQGVEREARLARRTACVDQRIRLLVARDFEQARIDSICSAASKALAFSVQQSGGQRVSVEIRVVPPRVSYRDVSWRVGRFPRLVLIAPDLAASDATLANVADLVAHEVFHVVMIAAGDKALAADEYVAYQFGLCGQLVANGGSFRRRFRASRTTRRTQASRLLRRLPRGFGPT